MNHKLKRILCLLTCSILLLASCSIGEFFEEGVYEAEDEEIWDEELDEDDELDENETFADIANEPLRILAIGDSLFDSVPDGPEIPEIVGRELGVNVLNNAHGGVQLVLQEDEQEEWGDMMDIRNQYISGDWDWIIMDGGGNDLNDDCGCGQCADTLDEIITADGQSGALPEAVNKMAVGNTRVMFMMYYDLPEGAEFGFDRCQEWLPKFESRIIAMGNSNPSVVIVDASDVVKATDLPYFQEDLVHPSQEGAEVIGTFLAEKIREQR